MKEVLIDLLPLFNHKMLLDNKFELDEYKGDFKYGICDLFYLKDSMKKGLEKAGKNKIFETYFVGIDKYDNFLCEGQVIKINKQDIMELSLYGFSEWSNFSEEIDIKNDRMFFKREIMFREIRHIKDADMWIKENEFNSNTLCVCTIESNLDDILGFYESKIKFENVQNIEFIKLPFNPAVHIFAIGVK